MYLYQSIEMITSHSKHTGFTIYYTVVRQSKFWMYNSLIYETFWWNNYVCESGKLIITISKQQYSCRHCLIQTSHTNQHHCGIKMENLVFHRSVERFRLRVPECLHSHSNPIDMHRLRNVSFTLFRFNGRNRRATNWWRYRTSAGTN